MNEEKITVKINGDTNELIAKLNEIETKVGVTAKKLCDLNSKSDWIMDKLVSATRMYNRINGLCVDMPESKKPHIPFVVEGRIPSGLYPYCRVIFDAVLDAGIPRGRTREVLKLVTEALNNVTPGEADVDIQQEYRDARREDA